MFDPSYCKVCMTLMGLNPTDSGRDWGCEVCHTDDLNSNQGRLFECSEEELNTILKNEPEFRKWYKKFKKLLKSHK